MGGGGGVSGAVSFPAYIEAIHEDWIYGAGPSALSLTVEDAMDTAFANDPYTAASFTNPSTDLAESKTQFDTFYSSVTALAELTDFATLLDQAVSKADECDIDDEIDVRTIINRQIASASRSVEEALSIAEELAASSVITDLISSFETRQATSRAKRITQFSASMADVGAMHSSAFLMGLGLIYAQEQEDSDNYNAQVSAQVFELGIRSWIESYIAGLRSDISVQSVNKEARERKVLTGLEVMSRMLNSRVAFEQSAAELLTEQNRVKIVATQEYEGAVVDLDVKSALWDMDIFGRGASILGAMSGYAHPLPEKPSRASSAIGGALKGAGTGAAIGSAIPGVGTLIGAGIGGLLGGIGGWFS